MTHLLTVPTSDSCWIARLVAFLAYMTLLAAVAAGDYSSGRAVLRKVSDCK